MANIGYLQVVRHCNHYCGFCSNPSTPFEHSLESMRLLVDDLVRRSYFGVVLTGGEPTLHKDLPAIARYAKERGLHVRMITNGHRLGQPGLAEELADAGVDLVHVSIYSVRPDVEARLRGTGGTLELALAAIENAHRAGIEVNVNSVINRHNADHLDENVAFLIERHPYVRHYVWNNLDPSMGRAEVNQSEFTPSLRSFEVSLHRALSMLHATGRSFRVERVPLCYMTDFAWASTETRKIVKGEERVVHFLDDKQTVVQTDWEHQYAPGCAACTLRPICGGLFDRGAAYDPEELSPVFVPREPIEDAIRRSLAAEAASDAPMDAGDRGGADEPSLPRVGFVSEESLRRYGRRREAELRRAEAVGVAPEPAASGDGDERIE